MFEALLNFEEESFFSFFQYPAPKMLDGEAIVEKLFSLTEKCKALGVKD